ncbi:hypothetical protein PR048_023689 [Dryococelus australis]|uniref:Uncharacterized protein n=1 Tax=Dryococelus australis TaxID=614101 RepID=A0ABQ9GUT6_9NEOP|nr:hypothetical protein PR048_023689 [Dryococelus australis]
MDCSSSSNRQKCYARHHTLLYFGEASKIDEDTSCESSGSSQLSSTSGSEHQNAVRSSFLAVTSQMLSRTTTKLLSVLLPAAMVDVVTYEGTAYTVCVLLDSTNQAYLMSEVCVRLPCRKVSFPVHGLTYIPLSSEKSVSTCIIKPICQTSPYYQVDAFVMHKIFTNLPVVQVDPCSWSNLSHVQLADPHFAITSPVDMLLGAERFACLFTGYHVEGDTEQPITLETV